MAVSLPPGYVSISTAMKTRGVCSVIGLVVDALPPKPSGGSSFVSTFRLKDGDFDGVPWNGLKVRCFNDHEPSLLCPGVGDAVVLRKMRVVAFRPGGDVLGSVSQSDNNVSWSVFTADSRDPSGVALKHERQPPPPSDAEKASALSMLNREPCHSPTVRPQLSSPTVTRSPAVLSAGATPARGVNSRKVSGASDGAKKFSLVRDLQYAKFADIVGEVVKSFHPGGGMYTLYVTDYTAHKDLFDHAPPDDDADGRDGDEFGYIPRKRKWPGPFGRMTLQVTLWDPHANYAEQHVKEEDFVELRNVQIRPGRSEKMEGALRTDRFNAERVNVNVIDSNDSDERVKEVLRRKIEYWKGMKGKIKGPEANGKRCHSEGEDASNNKNNSNSNKKKSKTQLRKERQKQRQRENQREKQETKADQPKLAPSLVKRDQLNSHVRASHPAVPCRSVRDVLENESHENSGPEGVQYRLPFQNLRYRLSVRVVDFFPPNLEDFAVQYNADAAMLADSNDNHLPDPGEDSNDEAVVGRRRWEWRFCLLVEDGGPGEHYARDEKRARMKVFVADADAVFLLCMDAEDLRANPHVLATLREKLFILWGDLEERKREREQGGDAFDPDDGNVSVSATPFSCCIKEYGVRRRPDAHDEGEDEDEADDNTSRALGWERRFRIFGTTIS